MKYTKIPISFEDQILKLEKRGMVFLNKKLAKKYFSNISFYRLRAYTYPFQDNQNSDHPFIQRWDFLPLGKKNHYGIKKSNYIKNRS